jgi:hypothetical protein
MARRWSLTLMMLLFGAGYAYTFMPFAVKVIRYYPAEHMWAFSGPDPSMAWFGKILIGTVLGLIGLAIGIALDKKGVSTDTTAAKTFDVLGWVAAMGAMIVATVHEVQVWMF